MSKALTTAQITAHSLEILNRTYGDAMLIDPEGYEPGFYQQNENRFGQYLVKRAYLGSFMGDVVLVDVGGDRDEIISFFR